TSTGIVAGETYLVVEPQNVVHHPQTKAPIGRYNDYRGQLRILCADATSARAIVTKSCREIHVGARLKPLPQLPIPLVRIPPMPAFCDPNSNRNRGVIISSLGWDEGLGEGNLVTINLGKDDSLQPGDFLVVYRDSPNPGQPRQVLGEIGILTTENHTATAKVVDMRRAMTIGDAVEAR
ncbi:MAG: LysM domain protein, partial [Acidobacteria bacterium]|nr:LysM domain protein [Acidobacteriota bacterium]